MAVWVCWIGVWVSWGFRGFGRLGFLDRGFGKIGVRIVVKVFWAGGCRILG